MSETSQIKSSNLERGAAACIVVGAVAAIAAVKFVNPSGNSFFPQCPLHQFTGLNCPGCGATRGMHALLNGDFVGALDYNLMLVVLIPLIIFGLLHLASIAVRGRKLDAPKIGTRPIQIFLAAMFIFGVVRNFPFYPFTILAP